MFVLLAAVLLAAAPPSEEVEARLRAGRAALSANDYAAAKQQFLAVLRSDSTNPNAHLNLGIIALVENDPEAGIRHFSAVPGEPRALIGKLDCELRLRRTESARETARQLDPLTLMNAGASGHVGHLLVSAGEYNTAIPFLRRARGAAAANLLGSAEEKAGNLPEAVKAFAEAVRLEPGNEDYRVDHAATLLDSGDVQGSVVAFRAAAVAFPASGRVQLGLGSALYLAGQHATAAQELLKAVRIEPSPRAFDLLGKAYESAGDLQAEIRAEFSKYLAGEPRDAAAYTHYAAMLQLASADPVAVRQALTRALQLDPNFAAAHLQLGIAEQTAGNTSAAAQAFDRAARLDPDNATVHYRLAGIYQKTGEAEKARESLERFRLLKAREKN